MSHLSWERTARRVASAAIAVVTAASGIGAQAFVVPMQGNADVVLPGRPTDGQASNVAVLRLSNGFGQWIATAFSGQPANGEKDVSLYSGSQTNGASPAIVMHSAHVTSMTIHSTGANNGIVGLNVAVVALRTDVSGSMAASADASPAAPFKLALAVEGLGLLHPKALASQTFQHGDCQPVTVLFDGPDYAGLANALAQVNQTGRSMRSARKLTGRLAAVNGGPALSIVWSGIDPTKVTRAPGSKDHPGDVTATFSCAALNVGAS